MIFLEYHPINENHLESALALVLAAYREERQVVPYLPNEEQFPDIVRNLIAQLFAQGSGYAAISNGEFVGFLAGFERGELWGRNKGIYSPLYGHGAIKEYRSSIYQGLYTKAAEMWAKKEHFTHALTFFAHDEKTISTWFWLGFGMRCVDSIRQVVPITFSSPDPAITISKGDLTDIPSLKDILTEFARFWPKAPTFVPLGDEDPVQNYIQWLEQPNRHFWVAYLSGEPVGQIRIQPGSETFISEHPDVMNVTSAFIIETGRQTGIGAMLLAEVQQWLLENNYPLCGVDFESFNVLGGKFWNRYFTPYTYSLVRRIDERIV